MNKINIGIVGYGNLGRGAEIAIKHNPDMNLVGVFTRRQPESVKTAGASVFSLDNIYKYKDKTDVLILCGGSATDLPQMTPELAKDFHVVDSFDNHSEIPQHFEYTDRSAKQGEKVAIISIGWDPGLFSLNRTMAQAILPQGDSYTFWGKGISQGHSDAVRRVNGVADARQYTIPNDEAIQRIRNGESPNLSAGDRHTRVCYVVLKDGANPKEVEREIVTMPSYFKDYKTTVHFITQKELDTEHSGLPHGGFVIHSGVTGENNNQIVEYSLQLGSNPEFTASVLVAYARAAYRLGVKKDFGCKTIFDIPVGLISPYDDEFLRANNL